MKRVLITGASGFIGRHALKPLSLRGYDVHAAARLPQQTAAEATWHQCDLMDAYAVERLMADVQPTHLLHLAWYTEHGKFWSAPENVDWVGASLQLLRAFQARGGRRVVMSGTCAEYEWNEQICRENGTPLNPVTLYGVCKNALRTIAERFAVQSGLSFAWGRVFFLYGPHESPERLVPFVTRRLLDGQPVPCTSGEQRRDFMHVEDTAAAFVGILDSDLEGAVNIASGDAVSVRDVVHALATTAGRTDLLRVGELPDRPSEPRLLAADITRLRSELDWKPRWPLAAGLANTVDWWREQLTTLER